MTYNPADRHRTLLILRCLCNDLSVRYGTHVLAARVAQSPRRKTHSTGRSWSDEPRIHRKHVIMLRNGDTSLYLPTDVDWVGHAPTTWSSRDKQASDDFWTFPDVLERGCVWLKTRRCGPRLRGRCKFRGVCLCEVLTDACCNRHLMTAGKKSNPLPDRGLWVQSSIWPWLVTSSSGAYPFFQHQNYLTVQFWRGDQ